MSEHHDDHDHERRGGGVLARGARHPDKRSGHERDAAVEMKPDLHTWAFLGADSDSACSAEGPPIIRLVDNAEGVRLN